MLSWWVVAIAGGVVVLVAAAALIAQRRALRASRRYVSVSTAVEPVDPLLRSQLESSLVASPASSLSRHQTLRTWAAGTSPLAAELDDARCQLRTLQTYVLGLDARYIKREEANWLTLKSIALVIGLVGGIASVVWELVGHFK
jgi:hypothetical protein